MDWEPPSVEHLQELLPQYQITTLVGRGGMGAVYRGRQGGLSRDVAIKLLPETVAAATDDKYRFADRFRQEAQAMAKLMHPAIVSVFDSGETADGQLYFVMEFIDGIDIFQFIQQHGGRVPANDAVAILCHVLDGLGYAHASGIIHRDIKPANVLIDHSGRVKVADFGLAKQVGSEADGVPVTSLTMTNATLGTPDYVPPEAFEEGREMDHRADLYSVGVMLYQMLTGNVPRGAWKSPTTLVPGLDPRIDTVVTKGIDPEPDQRYQSAAEMRQALHDLLESPPPPSAPFDADAPTEVITKTEIATEPATALPPPPTGTKRRPSGWLVGGIGAAIAIVGAIVFWPNPEGEGVAGNVPAAPQDSVFPLKPPLVPTRPTVECRLVTVAPAHVTEAVEDPLAEKIGELDLSNIVDFDTPPEFGRLSVRILLSDGDLRGWSNLIQQGELEAMELPKTRDGISVDGDHGILREGGRIYSGTIPDQFIGVPIVKTASALHYSVALMETGRPFSYHQPAADPKMQAFQASIAGERGVVDIATFQGGHFGFTLLFEDGTIQQWRNVGEWTRREPKIEQEYSEVVKLGRRGYLLLCADGEIGVLLVDVGLAPGELNYAFTEWKGQIAEIACFDYSIVAKTESGQWILMDQIRRGGRRWKGVEEAVRGAVEVTIQKNGLVYALLPKDEVPRSGFWKAEDLIAARKEIKETAGVFPLKPPPVPTRPEVECRLVVMPPDHVTDAEPGKLALKMAELDTNDIVEFQVRVGDNAVFFLSSDGAITGWDDGGATLKMMDGVPKSKDCVSVSNEMFLREGGRLYDVGATPAELIDEPVVRTAKHYQHRLALTAGGRVFATHESVRGNPEESIQKELSKLRGVVDVAARQYNGYTTTILFADGSVHCWVSTSDGWKRDMKKEQRLQHVTRLGKMGRIAIHADGSVSAFHLAKGEKQLPAVLAPWNGKIESIAAYGEDTIIARTSDGNWLLLDDIVGGGRHWGKAEAALRGAVDIVQRGDGLLYALLPKDEVPRSGFWRAEDLIAARKEAKEVGSKGTPIQKIAGGRGVPKFIVLAPENLRELPEIPEAFDGVATATLQPRHVGGEMGFIRADGTRWSARGGGLHRQTGKASAFFDAYFSGYLDDRGEVVLTNPARSETLKGSPIPKGPFRDVCSGNGFIGLLDGDGSVTVLANPIQIDESRRELLLPPPDLKSVVQLDGGNMHFVVRKADGSVVAWGANVAGACAVPPSLPPVRSVSAVGNACIAVTEKGEVVTWGGGLDEPVRSALKAIDDAETIFTGNASGSPIAIRRSGKRWFLASSKAVIAPEIADQFAGYDKVFLADDLAVAIHSLEE